MAVFFAFHVVEVPAYKDTLARVKAVRAGDAAARTELLVDARAGIARCKQHVWNRDAASLQVYEEVLDELERGVATNFKRLGRAAVVALALPLYQAWPRPGEPQSPNFASLAYDDARFYEFMSHDSRVATTMISSQRPEPYPIGDASVLLSRDDMQALHDAAVSVAMPSDPATHEIWSEQREQLVRVMRTGLDGADRGVMYSVIP